MLFIAMIVSLFYPGAKILLHVVAAMAIAATIWYVRMILTASDTHTHAFHRRLTATISRHLGLDILTEN